MAEVRPADWQCPNTSCLNHTKLVFGRNSSCPSCGTFKAAAPQPEAAQRAPEYTQYGAVPPEAAGAAPTDWQCPNPSCINNTRLVFGKRSSCPSCGTWKCPNAYCINNTHTVYGSKSFCPQCGTPKPFEAHAKGEGFLAMGGKGGAVSQFMAQLGKGMGMGAQHQGFGAAGNNGVAKDWPCPNSACVNATRMVFMRNMSCPKCGSPKPEGVFGGVQTPNGQKGGVHVKPGDWQCPNTACINHKNTVFGKHESCPQCGVPKPESVAGVFGAVRMPGAAGAALFQPY